LAAPLRGMSEFSIREAGMTSQGIQQFRITRKGGIIQH